MNLSQLRFGSTSPASSSVALGAAPRHQRDMPSCGHTLSRRRFLQRIAVSGALTPVPALGGRSRRLSSRLEPFATGQGRWLRSHADSRGELFSWLPRTTLSRVWT